MGYRKKAFRLEIRRGENGGFVAYNGDTGLALSDDWGNRIIAAVGEMVLDEHLRPAKIQKPPEPSPPTEGPEGVPPP